MDQTAKVEQVRFNHEDVVYCLMYYTEISLMEVLALTDEQCNASMRAVYEKAK